MNQVALYNIEKEIEGRVYRFSMQIGGQWSEAIDVAQQIADKVKELAELSAAQVAKTSSSAESVAGQGETDQEPTKAEITE